MTATGTEAREHGHYFKDVRNLDSIDVYRVLELWNVTHPALQHALKKVLAAGQRGAKDDAKDVQEAIDSLKRWQEMGREEFRQQVGPRATFKSQEDDSLKNRHFPDISAAQPGLGGGWVYASGSPARFDE